MWKSEPVGGDLYAPLVHKKIGYFLAAFIVIVLAVLAGHYLYGFATGTRFATDQWSAASAWASAGGATILALASVWLVRESEKRAKAEAEKTDERHKDELIRAESRLDRQIKAEWHREQARAVAGLWESVGRSVEPISRLAQVIEEHIAIAGRYGVADPIRQEARNVVSETYVVWRFQLLEVMTAIATAEMLVDEKTALADQIDSLKIRIERHMQDGKAYKNANMTHGGGAGVSMFMEDINRFMELRQPMTREVRRLLAGTTNAPPPSHTSTHPSESPAAP